MNIKDKALRVIEEITCNAEGKLTEKQADGIYRFSHIAVGRCLNKHLDWVKDLEMVYKSMIKSGDIKI